MASVARNTMYLTSALIGQKILSFIYFTLLARFLGPEVVGKYTFAIAFVTLFSMITDLGLSYVLIREVARAKERAQSYVQTVLAIKLVLAFVAYGAALGMAFILGHPTATLQLIALAGLIMVLDAFHFTLYGVLRGFQNLRYEAIGMVVGQGITLVFGVIALALHLPLYAFLIALGMGSVWNVLFAIHSLKLGFVSTNKAKLLQLWPCLHWEIVRPLVRAAIPFGLSGIFVKVYSYIDTVLLQHMRGDLEVGFYSVPYKITYAFQFLPLALSAALYPALSAAWKQDTSRMRFIFERAVRYSILVSFPIVFGIAALAPEIILTIYGSAFASSITPLKISIFGLIFIFLYFPVGAFLNASDRQSVNTFFMGLTMVANIILNLWLIPRFGAVGASIAAVSTNAFLWLGTLLWAYRLVHPTAAALNTLIKTLLAAMAMTVVVVQLKQILAWPLVVPIGGLVYVALQFIFRTIDKADLDTFRKLFYKQTISPS